MRVCFTENYPDAALERRAGAHHAPGRVESRGGEEFAFVVGSQRESFKKPHTPEFGTEEVSRLRRFLKKAGSESPSGEFAQPCRMVVVIDHHAAHVFNDLGLSRLQDEVSIKPYDPHHYHRHLVHRKEAHYRVIAFRRDILLRRGGPCSGARQ